jgi:hypothetical protein
VSRDPAAAYDLLERKQPHRLNFMHFARAIPGYVNQFPNRVPDNFIAKVATDVVEVACPCKQTPRCEYMIPVECACKRTFVYDGQTVRVAPSRVD